ncbi:virulence-associated E family protein [Enterococcus sp. CSURQ0835]|uniref:virulence-associated E family protein n=1 Tax=Enterococcus sp. CSURQ0835 TaxID=2681394 RepID=UPI00135CB239|nr:virulence-associated E family protein [Enterococcus sp. CSURQ0835]
MEQPAKKQKLNYDGEIHLAIGNSKTAKKWKNREMAWSDFLKRLDTPTITQETFDEYKKMPKSQQDAAKDVGGFVGGWLKQGARKRGHAQQRSLLTLDADSTTVEFWDDVQLLFDHAAAVYTTHSHMAKGPRYRLIIPLSRPVTAEEYEPLARKVAEMFGMDNFDDTTYQAERLMFWPSHSIDGDYFADYQDLSWLDPDEILSLYEDWRDASFWPESSRGHSIRASQAKKVGDPLSKKGIVGAFCRTYDIISAIETFLPDVYGPTGHEDRWTYLGGSTSGGLVIYEDKFAYSHHGTDPVGDQLVNAFDLVRIQKFGDLDEDVKVGTRIDRYPSYKAMRDFAMDDEAVRTLIQTESLESAINEFESDFEGLDEEDKDWFKHMDLEIDEYGQIKASAQNLEKIMLRDPNLKEKIFLNIFSNRIEIRKNLPWRRVDQDKTWKDADDAGLRIYIEKIYGIVSRGKVDDALIQEIERNSYDPVKEYLENLIWDNKPRVETLLIDYLGAEDNPYNRTVTRKFLAAAVARIFVPGIKFDYMLVTSGPQGIGKTLLPSKLAGQWFSNSLEGVSGKDAYEALQGVWIMEMGELSATKKADIEATKHFISKQEDIFRVAYGRHKSYFKRRCVFWGTTNDTEFLRDKTGNRRFWPVDVGQKKIKKKVWEMSEDDRDQLWAEAVELWRNGEELYLNAEQEKQAMEAQEMHTETSSMEGEIQEFLEIKITEDWYERSKQDRRTFIQGRSDDISEGGTVARNRICIAEVWNELYGGDSKNIHPAKAAEIRQILTHLPGWSKYKLARGRLKFGKDYGLQTAYVRDHAM